MSMLQVLVLSSTSWAETPIENITETIDYQELEQKSLELLQQVDALKHNAMELEEQKQEQETVFEQLAIFVDSRASLDARKAAIMELNKTGDALILPFYWTLLEADPQLSLAILDGLHNFPDNIERSNIIQKALYLKDPYSSSQTSFSLGKERKFGFYIEGKEKLNEDLVMKAITIAGQLQQTEIASILASYTTDMRVSYALREMAFSTLETNYAPYLAENEIPKLERASNMVANNIYAASIGATTSVLLGSVGVWGQSSVSEGLGYVGGAVMGTTGGYLYADQIYKPTLGQATQMLSSVAWGITEASVLAASFDMNDNSAALTRSIGALAGAGYGYWKGERDVESRDILELDFMGYWGAQMAVGLRDIIGTSYYELDDPYYDYTYYEDPELQAQEDARLNEAYEQYNAEYNAIENKKQQAMLIGSGVGLVLGHQLTDSLNIRPETMVFSGVYTAESAIASSLLINAFGIPWENEEGIVRTGLHLGMAGAIAYDYFHPVTYEQSLFSAYGMGIGHLLGSGIPMLVDSNLSDTEYKSYYHGMLWTGLAGTLAGTYMSNSLDFTRADWVMNGIGAAASFWHFSALSEIVNGYNITKNDQDIGLLNTGLGLSGLGLIYAGHKAEISEADSIFLGTTTAWGAYYGGLLPIAMGLNLETHEHMLMTLIASDIGLLGGSWAVFGADYAPKRSVLPQLLGVTGATMGALVTSLFTSDTQAITANTLGWGTIGLVGGAVWEKTKLQKDISLLPDLNLKMAKNLRFQMSPQVDQNGDIGVYVGLRN